MNQEEWSEDASTLARLFDRFCPRHGHDDARRGRASIGLELCQPGNQVHAFVSVGGSQLKMWNSAPACCGVFAMCAAITSWELCPCGHQRKTLDLSVRVFSSLAKRAASGFITLSPVL
jgi:hypothetical protein